MTEPVAATSTTDDGLAPSDPAATGSPRPVVSNPTDTPLTSVLDSLERDGYVGQMVPLEGGDIRCVSCRQEFPAADVPADAVRRLEGVSDPADMVIVVPLTCPGCGTLGALTARYGPDAGPEDVDVVAALPRTPVQGAESPDLTA